jgi:hypothetical protein
MPARSLLGAAPARTAALLRRAAAYTNSLGNGLAYDDEGVIAQNPTTLAGTGAGPGPGPWWPQSVAGGGLYRPLTSASFALEWGVSAAARPPSMR